MTKQINEPAFPHEYFDQQLGQKRIMKGATMRDYFAAKAMQSMNARPDYEDAPAEVIALDAYALADAMLRAREQT